MMREKDMISDAMDGANMAWWSMELPSGVVFFHPNKVAMLDREGENFFHYTDFTKLVHPDDEPKIMDVMRRHIDGETDFYETTYRIKKKDGSYIKFFDRGRVVEHRKGFTRIAGVVIDISTIKA